MTRSESIKNLKDMLFYPPTFMNHYFRPPHNALPNVLSPSDVHAMIFIMHKKRATMTQISKALSMSKPNVTTLINKLIEKGFAVRENDPDDRRVIHVSLTAAGNSILKKGKTAINKAITQKLDRLSEEQLELLEDILLKMKEMLDNDSAYFDIWGPKRNA